MNRRSWGVVLCAALLISCTHPGSRELPSPNPRAKKIRAKLDEIVIPEITFRDADVRDVANFISEQERKVLGDGSGVSMVVYAHDRPMPRITVNVRDATFREALNELCRQADMVWWIDERCIVIGPRADVRRVK